MNNLRADSVIRLHCSADGALAAADDHGGRVCLSWPEPDFVHKLQLRDCSAVHVLGSGLNASLIRQLGEAKFSHGQVWAPVKIGTPMIARSRPGMTSEEVFNAMTSLNLAPSLGGWHEMTPYDTAAYRLIELLQRSGGELDEHVRLAVCEHPAYPVMSYLHAAPLPAARMLAWIVDPRWFKDPVHPDRISRLNEFMGLSPLNAARLFEVEHPEEFRREAETPLQRALSVVECWHGELPVRRITAQEKSAHRGALMRNFAEHKYSARGLLKCSQRLLRWVQDVWLDQVSPQAECFAPDLFFESREAGNHFRHHLEVYRRRGLIR